MGIRRNGFIPAMALALTATAAAQTPKVSEVHPGAGGSPHVKAEWAIDGASVSITYGRPYLKGRTVGKNVEPMPKRVWRLGADEATTLTSNRPLRIGGTAVPAGSYTLWVLDTGDGWQLIVNSQTGQFGTEYDAKRDVARIPMTVASSTKPAEQLTISIRDRQLVIEWGASTATVPFVVG
jgi:hypothetical protein